MDEGELETVAAWSCAAGHSNRRIAQTIGRSEAWVRNLVRQKAFQERVLAILKERGQNGAGRFYSEVCTLVELKR
jgi:transposase